MLEEHITQGEFHLPGSAHDVDAPNIAKDGNDQRQANKLRGKASQIAPGEVPLSNKIGEIPQHLGHHKLGRVDHDESEDAHYVITLVDFEKFL